MQDKFVIYKSRLVLSDVTDAKDSGAYQCFVLAGKERIESRVARLRVFGNYFPVIGNVKRVLPI